MKFKGQTCKLRIEDLASVDCVGVEVSESLMSWFVVWKSDVLRDSSCMCFPSVISLLRSWVLANGEGVKSMEKFVQEKFTLPRDFDVLMVPYHDSGEWAVLYVCDLVFIHFSCPTGRAPPLPQRVYKHVAKMWAITCPNGRADERWQRANKLDNWRHVKSRVVTSKWESGWYVLHLLATLCDESGEGIEKLMAIVDEVSLWSAAYYPFRSCSAYLLDSFSPFH